MKLAWSLQDSTVPILAGAQLFSLRARRAASASSRTPCTSSPTACRRCPRGAARWPCCTSTTGASSRRGASSSTSPPAASRLPARQRLDGLDGAARRALRGAPRRRARGGGREAARAVRGAQRRLARGHLRRPGDALPRACAAARGDWDAARAHMAAAREAAERLSLGPMLALLDLDEARVLARRDGPGDADAARGWSQRARERAEALGVPVIGDSSRASGDARPAASAAGRPPSPSQRAATPAAALRREGDVWRVEYEGRTRYVKDAKGLRHLALLLDNPGVEFHAVDIVGAGRGHRRAPRRATSRATATSRSAPATATPARCSTPGQARVPHAPRGPARRDRGGRVVQRPRARRARPRGDGVHRARAVERRRPRRARPQGRLERRARPRERDARGEEA